MLSIYDKKRLHVDFLSSLSHESATAYHIYCREKTNFWLVLEEISALMVSPGNDSLGWILGAVSPAFCATFKCRRA